uniref:(northern house mosquito) hypothetical protein n=1 Tax=Culex pipiens TaxID=7175 RepID=A0A8D8F0N7_CULPI
MAGNDRDLVDCYHVGVGAHNAVEERMLTSFCRSFCIAVRHGMVLGRDVQSFGNRFGSRIPGNGRPKSGVCRLYAGRSRANWRGRRGNGYGIAQGLRTCFGL